MLFDLYLCVLSSFVRLLGVDGVRDQSPGVFLRDDPICGTQLENQSELRATSADRAAHYLDAAIAARTVPGMTSYSNT